MDLDLKWLKSQEAFCLDAIGKFDEVNKNLNIVVGQPPLEARERKGEGTLLNSLSCH